VLFVGVIVLPSSGGTGGGRGRGRRVRADEPGRDNEPDACDPEMDERMLSERVLEEDEPKLSS